MNFDYTYIGVFGYPIFEPMVILTNVTMFIMSLVYFRKLSVIRVRYSQHMGLFMLWMGISTLLGALAHAVHYQLGFVFFDVVFFLMNAGSLLSVYYCFIATLGYASASENKRTLLRKLLLMWIVLMLALCLVFKSFLLIKVHAALVIIFAISAHIFAMQNKRESGNKLVVAGFLVSVLSVVAHSLRRSLHEYFNYKDIAHVIMIISLVIIYEGVKRNALEISKFSEDRQ